MVVMVPPWSVTFKLMTMATLLLFESPWIRGASIVTNTITPCGANEGCTNQLNLFFALDLPADNGELPTQAVITDSIDMTRAPDGRPRSLLYPLRIDMDQSALYYGYQLQDKNFLMNFNLTEDVHISRSCHGSAHLTDYTEGPTLCELNPGWCCFCSDDHPWGVTSRQPFLDACHGWPNHSLAMVSCFIRSDISASILGIGFGDTFLPMDITFTFLSYDDGSYKENTSTEVNAVYGQLVNHDWTSVTLAGLLTGVPGRPDYNGKVLIVPDLDELMDSDYLQLPDVNDDPNLMLMTMAGDQIGPNCRQYGTTSSMYFAQNDGKGFCLTQTGVCLTKNFIDVFVGEITTDTPKLLIAKLFDGYPSFNNDTGSPPNLTLTPQSVSMNASGADPKALTLQITVRHRMVDFFFVWCSGNITEVYVVNYRYVTKSARLVVKAVGIGDNRELSSFLLKVECHPGIYSPAPQQVMMSPLLNVTLDFLLMFEDSSNWSIYRTCTVTLFDSLNQLADTENHTFLAVVPETPNKWTPLFNALSQAWEFNFHWMESIDFIRFLRWGNCKACESPSCKLVHFCWAFMTEMLSFLILVGLGGLGGAALWKSKHCDKYRDILLKRDQENQQKPKSEQQYAKHQNSTTAPNSKFTGRRKSQSFNHKRHKKRKSANR